MRRVALALLLGALAGIAQADEKDLDDVTLSSSEAAYSDTDFFADFAALPTAAELESAGFGNNAEWNFNHERQPYVLGSWQYRLSQEALAAETANAKAGDAQTAPPTAPGRLAMFVQAGQTGDTPAQTQEYFGTGIMLNNNWQAGDGIGVSIAHMRGDSTFPMIYSELMSSETSLELTYVRPLVDKLDAQTSIYYIQNNAIGPGINESVAAQVRLFFKF